MSKAKPAAQLDLNFISAVKINSTAHQNNPQKRSPSLNSKSQQPTSSNIRPNNRPNANMAQFDKISEQDKQIWSSDATEDDRGFGINVKKIVSMPRGKGVSNTAKTVPGTKLGSSSRKGTSQEGDRVKKLNAIKEQSLDNIKLPLSGKNLVVENEKKAIFMGTGEVLNSDGGINSDPSLPINKKVVEPPTKPVKRPNKPYENAGLPPKNGDLKKKSPIPATGNKIPNDSRSLAEKPPLGEKKRVLPSGKDDKTKENITSSQENIPELIENHSTIEDYRFKIDESQNDFDNFDIEDYMRKSNRID